MGKRIFTTVGLTFTASALGSAATTSAFMALKGGSTTQVVNISEVLISGMASASTLGGMLMTYASTLETGSPTAPANPNADGPMMINASGLTNSVVPFITAATTMPTPSNSGTVPKMNLALNFFGGIVRWVAYPTEEWTQVGNGTNGGESILFNCTGANGASGAANAHIVYEPF